MISKLLEVAFGERTDDEQMVRAFTKIIIEITLALTVLLNIAICICELHDLMRNDYMLMIIDYYIIRRTS